MAEFCKECFITKIEPGTQADKLKISLTVDLCESCGKIKPIVLEVTS